MATFFCSSMTSPAAPPAASAGEASARLAVNRPQQSAERNCGAFGDRIQENGAFESPFRLEYGGHQTRQPIIYSHSLFDKRQGDLTKNC
jgi:hypothetical protein